MLYYKKQVENGFCYYSSPFPPKNPEHMVEISQEEYEEYLASLEPTEEELAKRKELERQAKEEELRRLMQELYPAEEN